MIEQPPRTLCCWPGLAGLWLYGQWSSLVVAVGFSLLLNLALVSTFVWPAILSPELKILIWPAAIVCWAVFGWNSWRHLKQLEDPIETNDEPDDTLFIQAQNEYLKGDYSQAELLLAQRLTIDSRDAEARLLLVAIYRRTARFTKANTQMDKLQKLDTSIPWQFEIQRERQMLESSMSPEDESPEENENLHEEGSTETNRDVPVKLGESAVVSDETIQDDIQTNLSTYHQRAA